MNGQNQAMQMMNCAVSGQEVVNAFNSTISTATSSAFGMGSQAISGNPTLWGYWQDYYYPQVIRESYPVYIQERAMDKGKHAFELLKALMDKKLLKIEKVSEFIEAMDTILKTL